MLKLFVLTFLFIIGASILLAMYCACVIAGRSDDEGNGYNTEGADEEMLFKKQICPKCKVGKESYDLDRHSDACPYIGCWKDGKCSCYIPLEKPSKTGLFKKNENKTNVTPPPKILRLVPRF